MIDLYYWPTPNGHKVTLFLEEAALPYLIHPVNIREGDQFKPEFLAISPNNRMPAIIDHSPADGGKPVSLFESGAILLYLAEKTGKFISPDLRPRANTLQWLFWQMGGLGPMMGQAGHFANVAPPGNDYGRERYTNETRRLLGVLNTALAGRDYLAGDYSIADMASYPWASLAARFGIDLAELPNLNAWVERIKARPATARAYGIGEDERYKQGAMTEEQKARLYGKRA